MHQVRDAGAQIVEIGHSERREQLGETDAVVAAKVVAGARPRASCPLVCVGEPWSVRESGDESAYVSAQVRTALAGVAPAELDRVLVAYEPVWAIGDNGRAAEPDDVVGGARGAPVDDRGPGPGLPTARPPLRRQRHHRQRRRAPPSGRPGRPVRRPRRLDLRRLHRAARPLRRRGGRLRADRPPPTSKGAVDGLGPDRHPPPSLLPAPDRRRRRPRRAGRGDGAVHQVPDARRSSRRSRPSRSTRPRRRRTSTPGPRRRCPRRPPTSARS